MKKYDNILDDSLTAADQQRVETLMSRLSLDTRYLPGRLRVKWDVSAGHLSRQRLRAMLTLPDFPTQLMVSLSREEVDDINATPDIQRQFNSELSHLYIWQAGNILRGLEAAALSGAAS